MMKTAKISGDTYDFRNVFKSQGWEWIDKSWVKFGNWGSAEDVEREIRSYDRIRNRGKFIITLEVA